MAPVYMINHFAQGIRVHSNLYMVTVIDFDQESNDYEIMAESADEAAQKAMDLAAQDGMYDICDYFITEC